MIQSFPKPAVGLVLFLSIFVGCSDALVQLPAPPTSNCVVPPVGLVHWWTGDGTGQNLASGLHGTVKDGATFTQGKVATGTGQAFRFNGLDAVVEVRDDPSLRPTTGFTLEAWARLDDLLPNNGAVVAKGDPLDESFGIDHLAGIWRGWIRPAPNVFVPRVNAGEAQIGVWTHLAMTWDGATMRFYRNGALMGSVAVPTVNTAEGVLTIGHRSELGWADGDWDFELKGAVDEVAYYNRALNEAEVDAIHGAGVDGKCKS